MLDSQNNIDELLSIQYLWKYLRDKRFKINMVSNNVELIDNMNFIEYISSTVKGNTIVLTCINPKSKFTYIQCKLYCIMSYVTELILLELRNHNINRKLSDTMVLSRIGIGGDLEDRVDSLICRAMGYQNKYISKTMVYDIIKQIVIYNKLKQSPIDYDKPEINYTIFKILMRNFDKYLFSETNIIYLMNKYFYKRILDGITLTNNEMTNDSLKYHS